MMTLKDLPMRVHTYAADGTFTTEDFATPPDVQKKYDSNKPDLSILPLAGLCAVAAALSLGEKKYGRHDFYKGGIESHRMIAAALRHLYAWESGEDNDPESGASHLGHAAANCLMLLAQMDKGTLNDSRRDSK